MDTSQREFSYVRPEEVPLQKILLSGDPHYIAQNVGLDTILEHFGEESFEHLAYEHHLADQLYDAQNHITPILQPPRYIIPKMTENPAVDYGICKQWIRQFCNANNLKLPSGFHSRNKKQLQGMFYGMLETYGFGLQDIVAERV